MINSKQTNKQDLSKGTNIFNPVTLTFFKKKPFKLANNFWKMSARALIFHMSISRDQPGYQHILPCDLDLWVWLTIWKVHIRALICHISFILTWPFWGYHHLYFYHVTLSLNLQTLNLQIILNSECFNKSLKFQKIIPCDETFRWVPTFFTL